MLVTKNKSTRKRYCEDTSIYRVIPEYVAFPKNEQEIVSLVEFATRKKLPITARGGGTGASGGALGKGVVIDFSKHLNSIVKLGTVCCFESGTLLKKINSRLLKKGLRLHGTPLYDLASIGGNLNTDSVGITSLKYGTFDSQVLSVRGVLADGRIIDTSKKLPADIVEKLDVLSKEIKNNKQLVSFIKKRAPLAGGYNLGSLLLSDPNQKLTHLVCGSAGTLLLATQLRVKCYKNKPLHVGLCYVDTLAQAQSLLNTYKTQAVLIEFIDAKTLSYWPKQYRPMPKKHLVIIGFEKVLTKNPKDIVWVSQHNQQKLWKHRATSLLTLKRSAMAKGLDTPSILDDVTFHPKDFAKVLLAIDSYFKKKNIVYAAYGHIGVGSLHIRPFIKASNKVYQNIQQDILKIMKNYHGTLIGEHNIGPSKSWVISKESQQCYTFMKKIKKTFDPKNLLNPYALTTRPGVYPLKQRFK